MWIFRLGTSGEIVRAVRGHELEFGIVGSLGAAPEIDGAALEDEIVLVGGPELTAAGSHPP